MDTIDIIPVIEYSAFFPEEKESLDIVSSLKKFSRHTLIKMATLLSLQYGNLYLPNNKSTLFSVHSQKYIKYLNIQFKLYCERMKLPSNVKVILCTFRTSLELWRNIFAIKVEDFQATVDREDEEFLLFKIILALNENIFRFNSSQLKLDESLFLNSFLTNDCNQYDFQSVFQPQIYYFYELIKYIPNNSALLNASKKLFSQWGISSWKEYYSTILYLAYATENYRNRHQKGMPVIDAEQIKKDDQTGYFSPSLLEKLSIDEDEFIPYDDEIEPYRREYNIDFRILRSKPFVKLKDGTGYVVINIQLLCERLFNSLYFDFLPLIKEDKSLEKCDFNKDFVEKTLFRNTLFQCLDKKVYTFPARKSHVMKEDKNEPDFYIRRKEKILILECKAIKMNGALRDRGDYMVMLEELRQKLALKTYTYDANHQKKELKKTTLVGLGQLMQHINSIEADTFQWDPKIPDEVAYYPVLVFEDVRLLQPGLLSILNRWFLEIVEFFQELDLHEISCRPVMAISINTLFLYDDIIKRKGLTNLIDEFLKVNVVDGQLLPWADFDAYLKRNNFRKKNMVKEITTWLKSK